MTKPDQFKRSARNPGRPSKQTAELVADVAEEIEKGSSLAAAAVAHGIHPDTLRRWLKGEAGSEEFRGVLQKAKAWAVMRAEQRVYAGGKQWRSSARWLESVKRKRWARHRMPVMGAGGAGGPAVQVRVGVGLAVPREMADLAEQPPAPGLRSIAEIRRLAEGSPAEKDGPRGGRYPAEGGGGGNGQ